ncbi:MAG: phosphoribosylamine--glycine ligase [Gemmatimonadota bacterium]|nr:phosphoribosylamine--glycine ligase [Gemmatimonadota bacterium]
MAPQPILLVGSGGREHALAAKIRLDAPDTELLVAPGNPGTAAVGRNVPVAADDIAGLVGLARSAGVGLTIVGPEAPLAAGIADAFAAEGLPLFGPSAAAARIESSKAFAKTLMRDEGVPTAAFEVFRAPEPALARVRAGNPPFVVKASGLAGGKGAFVCPDRAKAERVIRALMVERTLGNAADEILLEEYLEGEELSVFFLTDGETAVPLVPSRDHKRRFEKDEGPNTGGMGAFAPVPGAGPDLVDRIRREVAEPVLAGLAARGCPYRGFLYAGLMLTADGPRVIEFNCRLGDPEAQAVLPLTGGDLVEPVRTVASGARLSGWDPDPAPGAALVTVVVSGGYPGPVEKGVPIEVPAGLEGPDVRLYHAGTSTAGGRLVTAGGRVFGVTGLGATLAEASERSRAAAARIRFEGADWRSDIGRVR